MKKILLFLFLIIFFQQSFAESYPIGRIRFFGMVVADAPMPEKVKYNIGKINSEQYSAEYHANIVVKKIDNLNNVRMVTITYE